ncbi:hypothetical protein [Botrimarina sp.]|uniref:hypothetical protein n=1 Tax=Botrimarina sp. TaxID=2795802 RepID=UPI0032ED59C4
MSRAAFSLIELLLAIALSITLVALLGSAINLHLIRLDDSRTTVDQAHLARAVLDLIAADLRAVTTAPTQDVSELMAAAEAAARFDVDEVDDPAEDPEADAAGASADPAADDDSMPGVNGTADTITLDVRLLSQSLVTAADPALPPTARIDAGWSQVVYGMSQVAGQQGLVRTIAPRDAALWLVEQGQAAPVAAPIAQEVIGFQLQYYDGAQYQPVWDMNEQQAAPLGVLVTIQLLPADEANDPTAPLERRNPRTYQRFVRLPAAADQQQPTEEADASADGPQPEAA